MEVILAKGDSLVSRLIMKVTGGRYSHVALRYGHPESDWIIHSTVGGIQPEWWFYFERQYKHLARFWCLFDVADKAADRVVEKIGHAPYDYQGFVGQGLAYMLDLERNPLPSKNNYRCTEFLTSWHTECNRLDSSLGLQEFDSEMVSPQDLFEYYRRREDAFALLEET